MGKKTIAVIDVGSNTIRTCVYRTKGRESSFKKAIDVSKAVGLASYVDDSGALSSDGIEAGARTLSQMTRVSELAGSDKIIILATGVIRNSTNTSKAVKSLTKKVGYPICVLSGEEEALMSATGASWSTGIKTGAFFDLGGGSTELAVLRKGAVAGVDSIPIGALSSWKRESKNILPSAEEIEAIETGFALLLKDSPVCISAQPAIVGVGGSMRLALKVTESLRGNEHGRKLDLSDLDMILDAGICDQEKLCKLVLKLKPERIHTFLPGCAIAREILRASNCSALTVSKAGLREGCLISELNPSFLKDFARI